MTVTATLFAEIEDPGEVDVNVIGYEQWIPEGNLDDESRAGNTGWWEASHIRVFKVLSSWTVDRKVDNHRDFGGGPGKWATKIDVDETEVNEHDSPETLIAMREQWAASAGPVGEARWTPKEVDLITIFPGRIRYSSRYMRNLMLKSLQTPQSQDEQEIAAWLLNLGLPKAELLARIQAITAKDIADIARERTLWAALHETAHACGVGCHLAVEGKHKGKESQNCPARVPACPMQYATWDEKYRHLLFGERGGLGGSAKPRPIAAGNPFQPRSEGLETAAGCVGCPVGFSPERAPARPGHRAPAACAGTLRSWCSGCRRGSRHFACRGIGAAG